MEKNKKLIYILGIILIISVILNIYFIYQLNVINQFPPANFHGIL